MGARALKWWQYECTRGGRKFFFKSRHPPEYTVRSDRAWNTLEKRAEAAEALLKQRALPGEMYDKDSKRKNARDLSPAAVSCLARAYGACPGICGGTFALIMLLIMICINSVIIPVK